MTKKKGGRPARTFSDKEKARVCKLAGYGLTQEQIAKVMLCDAKTLIKHCGEAWETGKLLAIEQVADKLFQNIKKGDPASIFFYLKTQAHWKETQTIEVEKLPRLRVTRDDN